MNSVSKSDRVEMFPDSSATSWRNQILEYMRYERKIEERRERERNWMRERDKQRMWGGGFFYQQMNK